MTVILFLLFIALLITGGILTFLGLQSERNPNPFRGTWTFIAAVPVLLLWLGVTVVNAGTVGVVTRNGAVARTLNPGLHFILPLVESCHPMTTQTLVIHPDEDAATLDLQMVHTQVTLAYHFDPSYMAYIYSQLADSTDQSVERKTVIPAILEAIKASTAQYNAPELVNQRPAVRDRIENYVQGRLAPYHIIAENVSITDFHFSPEYEKSIEQKQTAQQDAEREKNVLDQVQIQAQQKVAAAKGEADALRSQMSVITPELLQLRTIEMFANKWDGRLPENYYGGTAPMPIMSPVAPRAAIK